MTLRARTENAGTAAIWGVRVRSVVQDLQCEVAPQSAS